MSHIMKHEVGLLRAELCGALLPLLAAAATIIWCETSDAAAVDFRRDIGPILQQHCVKCHGSEKQQGGLRLDSRELAIRGGDSGEPAIVKLNATSSQLIRRVTATDRNERMPPEGDPLSAVQIELLRRWIDGGAVWPATDAPVAATPLELVVTQEDRQHWAFLPLQKVPVPEVQNLEWVRNEIDQFVLRGLQAAGLQPNSPADSRTLIRRVYFDLIGLPPELRQDAGGLQEVRLGMELDSSAVSSGLSEQVIAQLLQSSHYGERWARHWLDVVRYADSNGQEGDADRPHAWRYRDFVIRAFNDDLPFDEFVRWQLAGDELAPERPDAIAATGFIVAGNSTQLNVPMEEEKLRNRANELDDMVSTTGQAFLGMTLGCCRCHDHKYDPIPSRDYYRMMRIFNSGDRRDVPLAAPAAVREHQQRLAAWQVTHDEVVRRRDDWLQEARRPVAEQLRLAKINALDLDDEQKQLLISKSELQEAKQLAERHRRQLSVSAAEHVAALPEPEQQKWRELDAAVSVVDGQKPAELPLGFAFADFSAEAPESWFFERGDFLARREKMSLGFLTVLTGEKTAADYWERACEQRQRDDSTQQRSALAAWMTDVEHGAGALLARVLVNRVWQQHFGEGLVRTPNDFGTRGERPSHPELLEWLAAEFVHSGWSIRHLQQLIVSSGTYQQSSVFDAAKAMVDPENRLLWRFVPRRLEAEALRDATLAAAGTLNTEMYGPGFRPPIAVEAMQARNVKSPYPRDIEDRPENRRRSVYLFHKRVVQYPLMQAFDAPDAQVSCGQRTNTTVAPQALALLNDPFVRLRAQEMSARLEAECGEEPEARVRRAFQLTLARDPGADELTAACAFVAEQAASRRQRAGEGSAEQADGTAWTDFCQALFGLNEFIYVD